MDFQVLGPLSVRVFGNGCSLKPFPHSTGGHTHNHDHPTVLWGRHRLKEWAPVCGDDGVQKIDESGEKLWYLLRDVEIVGNGPDSILYVPAQNLHDLIALEPGCFHACFFLHQDEYGNVHPTWFGRKEATI